MSAIVPADAAAVTAAAQALRDGLLVAFPTETVYGLGADARNPAAVRAIFAAKGRPADHPVIVHVHDAARARRWSRAFPAGAQRLADAFWPGPLTLIVPRAADVDDLVTGGQDSVGLRVPSHPVARALLAQFGGALAAPSANRFGHVSPTSAAHVADDLGDAVAMILDGGDCPVGIESTIVAFTGRGPALLRPGGVPASEIERVLGVPLQRAASDAPRASGTLPSHYAPRTPSNLVAPDALAAQLRLLAERDERAAVLARVTAPPPDFDGVWLAAPRDPVAYAHDLYANLRRLDTVNADVLVIEDVPDDAAWLAVRDRLARATRGIDDDTD
jgi:L-threonylcarbamoyladenylate synthase